MVQIGFSEIRKDHEKFVLGEIRPPIIYSASGWPALPPFACLFVQLQVLQILRLFAS
jgi:hypothetical protein